MNNIESHKLQCVHCGLCKSVCPKQAIDIIYSSKNGFFNPVIDTAKCIECGLCRKHCPVGYTSKETLLGDFKKGYLAHATREEVRFGATSGGIINRLILFLLKEKVVDAVLLVCHDSESPIEANWKLLTIDNMQMLDQSPRDFASRYVVVPILEEFSQICKAYGRLAVVGTPCQIAAVKNYDSAQVEVFKIGITCSGGLSYIATEEYKRKIGCNNTATMFYRGNGWPGKNTVCGENKMIESPHQGSMFERMFSSQVFKMPSCRKCEDHFAEQSDISFCDYWNVDEMETEMLGNSCVIIRNGYAQSIFNRMVTEGIVEVVKELTEDDIIKSQTISLKAKKGDLRKKISYKVFSKILDGIRILRVYRLFNIKIYRRIAVIYSKMCRDSNISFK